MAALAFGIVLAIMDYAHPKYFDYLVDYGDILQRRIKYPTLVKDIERCRKTTPDDPEAAGVKCRKILEHILRSLIQDPLAEKKSLYEMVTWVKRDKIVSASIIKKADKIRRQGNDAAHKPDVISVAEAQRSLVYLDEILRYYIKKTRIDSKVIPSIKIADDSILIIQTEKEMKERRHRAKTADLLSGEKLEAQEKKVQAQVRGTQMEMSSVLEQIDQLYDSVVNNSEASSDPDEKAKALVKLNAIYDAEKKKCDQAKQTAEKAAEAVENILNEYDYINILLRGDKRATPEQLDVMAYPRTTNATSRILSINGGAGTGKTLCLLAKLIRDVDQGGQESFSGLGESHKNALFVCFNKPLANYIENILQSSPNAAKYIEVESFDMFVNQLAKNHTNGRYDHLSSYAQDVRFEASKKIHYEASGDNKTRFSLLKESMNEVSSRYPNQKNAYFFDIYSKKDMEWLNDEIIWIEGRYDTKQAALAGYPKDARTGRGGHRKPREDARKIILEIWSVYSEKLASNNLYTIEQAVKRLESSGDLPKFDSIAIDEAQDFALRSIRLLMKMRRGSNSGFYISGDEGQKIYQRDFTWKELDENIRAHTVTLKENKRNPKAIHNFADRLLGKAHPYETSCAMIQVMDRDDAQVKDLAQRLARQPKETTALIGFPRPGFEELEQLGVEVISARRNKGLEFDNVVVDCTHELSDDPEEERRLRYVHFTRARKRLYIRYQGNPPHLLRGLYPEFVGLEPANRSDSLDSPGQ